MNSANDRRKALSFDREAELYDRVRPRYPAVLFDNLIELTGLRPGNRVLEIGAGTGIATRVLAERGFAVTALEPGPAMAAIASHKLSSFPNSHVIVSTFEEWALPAERFDLVLAATAFHWLDRTIRYEKSAAALREGGHLAIVEYSHVAGGDDTFFSTVQGCYERFVPGTPTGLQRPVWNQQPDTSEIETSPFFDLVAVRQFKEEIPSTRAQYLDLLTTYSGSLTLRPENRNALFDCIGSIIDANFGGRITKAYRHELILARHTSADGSARFDSRDQPAISSREDS